MNQHLQSGGAWTHFQELTAADGQVSDRFGQTTAINGETVVIGSAMADVPAGTGSVDSAGAVYSFAFSNAPPLADAGGPYLVDKESSVVLDATASTDANQTRTSLIYAWDLDGDGEFDDAAGATPLYTAAEGPWVQVVSVRVTDEEGASDVATTTVETVVTGSPRVVSLTQTTKLLASDGVADDLFGWSPVLSADGDTLLVASLGDSDQGWDSGSVYVYRRQAQGWSETLKLTASDGKNYDHFGYSNAVSDDGNTIVIGASSVDAEGAINAGAAYVYRFDPEAAEWLETKLTPPNAGQNQGFGYAVSMSADGNTIAIGEPQADVVHVYRFDGVAWSDAVSIQPSDAPTTNNVSLRDQFGWSVSISPAGDALLIASRRDDDLGTGSGSAYVFRFDGSNWIEESKLLPSDGAEGDVFGQATDLSANGRIAVIGSYLHDAEFDGQGAAYVYEFDGSNWTHKRS